MTDEEIMFERLFAPIKAKIQDKNRDITYLEKENAELKKRIEEYNLCGNTVDKQTYNEVVNENAQLKAQIEKLEKTIDQERIYSSNIIESLKAKLQKITDFVNSCKRSTVADMLKEILTK